ncbi:MAG: arylformamidase [Clostridiales bacterium]|jgi:arylformamidase|nr:arylformamidase [Clostridiales bacterium]MDN5298014.1 arylformamidase [Clostridiales bacterium]
MKDWLDISMAIFPDMIVYKNKTEKKPKFISRATHDVNGYQEGSIEIDLHLGTHVDMPKHILADGHDSSVFNVSAINGACTVIDFSHLDHPNITADDLAPHQIMPGDIVILKTHNSFAKAFDVDFDYLDPSGAQLLADAGVKAVGIDALGIERSNPDHPTHRILLGRDIYIVEGLALADIEAGRYTLMCLPLKIEGVEGLPARAFLKP